MERHLFKRAANPRLTGDLGTLGAAAGAISFAPSPLRRRFLVIAIAGLTILLSTMTVSYLGSTGTTTATVNAKSSAFIYPIASGNSLPNAVTSLEYTAGGANITAGTGSNTGSNVITTATVPSWSPNQLSAGSVTTAGDIALIDGTISTGGVEVSLYIINLAALQSDYSSFAFPIDVYSSGCSTGCSWKSIYTTANPAPFLTSTSGYMTFNLPVGSYYDIVFDTGGSYYCTSTTDNSSTTGTAELAPQFYLTAQPY